MTREEALKKVEELLATYNQGRISMQPRVYLPPEFAIELADLIVKDYKEAVELLQEAMKTAEEQSVELSSVFTHLNYLIGNVSPDEPYGETDPTITVM